MTADTFIVYFEGFGYYAEKQPTYTWCFTEDWKQAKEYSTVKGVTSHVTRASHIGQYMGPRLPFIG